MNAARSVYVLLTATLALALVLGLLVIGPVSAQTDPPSVEVGNVYFAPTALTVEVGQQVTFDNVGGTHTVSSDSCADPQNNDDSCATNGSGEAFNSGVIQSGTTFAFTFDEPGTYAYFCDIHSSPGGSGQNGTITVAEAGQQPTEPPVTETPQPPAVDGQPPAVSGDDPVETALAWSSLIADDGADVAVIGTSGGFADSLASGLVQGQLDAPLLLTDSQSLDQRVADELTRLGTTRAIILGGVAAISEQVENDLTALVDTVERVAGDTRIRTAQEVLRSFGGDADTVIMARAFGEGSAAFADALAAGAVAAATGIPVVLNPTDTVDVQLADNLEAAGIDTIILAGGTAAISDDVMTELDGRGFTVVRAAGGSRFSTATRLSQTVEGLTGNKTLVEGTGDLAWASGFASALHAGGGVVLSAGEALPGDTLFGLLERGTVVCGPTISQQTCGIAQAAGAVEAGPDQLYAVLDADQEVPPNDSRASGQSGIKRAGADGVCLTAQTNDLTGPITVSHIHAGAFGVAGAPVVPLSLSLVEDLPGVRLGCAAGIDPAVIDAVFADPAGHYVNIHTDANPAGEIRGQVFTYTPELEAVLTGASEVPGPGAPEVTGFSSVYDTGVADELCYVVDQGGLTPAAGMGHIHRGAVGESGPIVVPLGLGEGNRFAHCDRGLDPALVAEILDTPSAFYVNLHNVDFPAGAIRGNLGPAAGGGV